MDEKAVKEGIRVAKAQYFAAADAVLERHNLAGANADSFRKLLQGGKKKPKKPVKKAAS